MTSLAVLDVHITTRWKHDTKTGPQVVRVPADELLTVAADNGFQDQHTEYEIPSHDVEYLVHYRGLLSKAAKNNALIRAKGYSQRWMAEIRYSTAKRSLGWHRQFRKIAPMFTIINIEPLCEPL